MVKRDKARIKPLSVCSILYNIKRRIPSTDIAMRDHLIISSSSALVQPQNILSLKSHSKLATVCPEKYILIRNDNILENCLLRCGKLPMNRCGVTLVCFVPNHPSANTTIAAFLSVILYNRMVDVSSRSRWHISICMQYTRFLYRWILPTRQTTLLRLIYFWNLCPWDFPNKRRDICRILNEWILTLRNSRYRCMSKNVHRLAIVILNANLAMGSVETCLIHLFTVLHILRSKHKILTDISTVPGLHLNVINRCSVIIVKIWRLYHMLKVVSDFEYQTVYAIREVEERLVQCWPPVNFKQSQGSCVRSGCPFDLQVGP